MKTSSDYLDFHALDCPNKIAVIDHDLTISYAQFHQDSRQLIALLGQFNLSKGSKVAIEWTSLYPHWLILIACEHLGWISFSFSRDEYALHEVFLKSFDLIIGSEEEPKYPTIPYQQLTEKWLNTTLNGSIPETIQPSRLTPDDPMRIQCSSGTTGSPKYMIRSLSLNDFRIKQLLQKDMYSKESRVAICYGFPVQAAYGRACACLHAGGQVIFDTRYSLEGIAKCHLTHIALMPDKVIALLHSWPQDTVLSDKFRLSTFGGKLSSSIRKKCLAFFASEIIESYGINETGSIATILSNEYVYQEDIGVTLPELIVESVNEEGTPTLNQLGRIRIKTPGLVDGYMNDPIKTDEMFKEGWFYPGDYGFKIDDHHVKIVGRIDDVVNVGGNKINASDLEDQLRPHLENIDFCVAGLIQNQTDEVIWVLVKSNPKTDLEHVKSVLSRLAALSTSLIKLKIVDHIPRTSNGKVKRKQVKRLLN